MRVQTIFAFVRSVRDPYSPFSARARRQSTRIIKEQVGSTHSEGQFVTPSRPEASTADANRTTSLPVRYFFFLLFVFVVFSRPKFVCPFRRVVGSGNLLILFTIIIIIIFNYGLYKRAFSVLSYRSSQVRRWLGRFSTSTTEHDRIRRCRFQHGQQEDGLRLVHGQCQRCP